MLWNIQKRWQTKRTHNALGSKGKRIIKFRLFSLLMWTVFIVVTWIHIWPVPHFEWNTHIHTLTIKYTNNIGLRFSCTLLIRKITVVLSLQTLNSQHTNWRCEQHWCAEQTKRKKKKQILLWFQLEITLKSSNTFPSIISCLYNTHIPSCARQPTSLSFFFFHLHFLMYDFYLLFMLNFILIWFHSIVQKINMLCSSYF